MAERVTPSSDRGLAKLLGNEYAYKLLLLEDRHRAANGEPQRWGVRDMRSELHDAPERIAALENDNRAVMGNGQPARLTKVEDALLCLKLEVTKRIWWCLGAAAGVSGFVAALVWIIRR